MATLDVEGPVDVSLPPAPDQSYRASVEWVLDVLGPQDVETTLVATLAARLGPERDGTPTLVDVTDIGEHVDAGPISSKLSTKTSRTRPSATSSSSGPA